MKTWVHVTDSHFRQKSPVNRTDDILESLFEKFEWVLKYAKDADADIIHTGDLFHSPSISDFIAIKIIKLIKNYKRNIYFLIGNHDVTGGNSDSYDYAKVGLFAEHDWFHLIAKKPIFFDDHVLCGYDFSKQMECPEVIYPDADFNLQKVVGKKKIMCCVHSMITDEPSVIVEGRYKTIRWNIINSTADLVLTGHYHPGFNIQENSLGVRFVNPGAMIRQEASKIDISRKPQITLIEIGKELKTKYIEIPHKKDVFDVHELNLKFNSQYEKQAFVEALRSLSDEELMGENVITILEKLDKKTPNEIKDFVNKKVIVRCIEKIKELQENG